MGYFVLHGYMLIHLAAKLWPSPFSVILVSFVTCPTRACFSLSCIHFTQQTPHVYDRDVIMPFSMYILVRFYFSHLAKMSIACYFVPRFIILARCMQITLKHPLLHSMSLHICCPFCQVHLYRLYRVYQ